MLVVSLLPSAAAAAPRAQSDAATPVPEQATVEDVVVRGAADEALKAAEKLEKIPGGASLVTSEEIERGRVSNPADILSREPGVFAQSTSGGEAIRLSIRGSGIQRSPLNYLAGVSVLLDGIPITTSTGVPWELVEPLAANHITILRGANAFEFGAKSLGGAIDYVSHTGYDSQPFQARAEAGSFGYWRGQVSSGEVIGPFDYYISASGFRQDGYRAHSEASSVRFVANLGYKVSDDIDTRFFFRFAHEYFQVPNTISWAQLQADPRQAAAAALNNSWYKVLPYSEFIGNKTRLRFNDMSALEFAFAFKRFPQSGAGGPFVRWDASDISASLKYTRSDDLGGHTSNTTLSALSSTALDTNLRLEGWPGFFPAMKNALINYVNLAGSDVVVLGSNDFELTSKLWLTTGIALSYSPRTSEFIYPISSKLTKDYLNYAPRAGLRYYLTPDVQLFGNVSRSVEPPTNWSFPKILFPTAQLGNLNLKEQTAWTAEGGLKGKFGPAKWEFAYYHSWIDNELLTVTLPGTALTATTNATATRHQGVELSLDTLLWRSKAGGAEPDADSREALTQSEGVEPGQQLVLRQTYTWNDFHYRNDPIYRDNRLPSIPVHFYKAELEYRHRLGFYAGLNVESNFISYPVDYANSLFSRPYAILGARIGYLQPKQVDSPFQWEAYLEGRNLANVKYAAVVNPTFNANGRDAAVFYPGDGVGIYGGVTLRY
ncbi:TonB-dependent receptor family protein [Methylosinus sp. LW4]|uniref:TonB-dependent receptor family protein n=1 Tax=Methylosinus sp. LW4 TaxID=136993 RepID=UPI0018DED7BD|nr:TonB-dependent receptor [Methylosinus sp. LW4]